MQIYQQNKNNMHGILIKNSDMDFQTKHQITKLVRESISKYTNDVQPMMKISRRVTHYLQQKFEGAWICTLGRKFTANVMHEPGYFLRASTEDYHILILKLKMPDKIGKVQKPLPLLNHTAEKNYQKNKQIFNLLTLS